MFVYTSVIRKALGSAAARKTPMAQSDLGQIALRLNHEAAKTLGVQTPADTFERAVALTG